jgi:hypothetical protein
MTPEHRALIDLEGAKPAVHHAGGLAVPAAHHDLTDAIREVVVHARVKTGLEAARIRVSRVLRRTPVGNQARRPSQRIDQ